MTKKTTTTKKTAKPVSAEKAKAAVEALVTTIAADLEAAAPVKPAKKAPAKKSTTVDDALHMRLYAKGEFYFGKLAAARINGLPQMAVEVKGKTITLTPTKAVKDTLKIGACHTAPVLRAAKLLADTGWSKKTQDLVAKPVGDAGFRVEVK